jgi:type I restriction enzyme S subunit
MKKYDSYKDSGVEWIGEIPSGWEELPLRFYFSYTKGSNGQKLTKTYIEDNKGDFPVYSGQTENNGVLGYVNEYEFDYEFPLVFTTTVGAKFMSTRLLEGKFSLSQNCLVMIKKKECLPSYFQYLLSFDFQYRRELIPTIIQPSLRMEDLDRMTIIVPPLSEQQQIVSYLDTKTSLIDSLIEKTQRKIQLLKDSIPNYHFYSNERIQFVEMKEYWFQKKPSDWGILKLRELFDVVSERNHPDERLLSVHQIKGVIYRDEQLQDVMNPSGDISNYKLVKPGDFIISLRSSEGGFEYSEVTGLVSPVYTVLRPKFKIDTIFYKYLFKTHNFIVELNRFIKGIRDGKNINFVDIRDVSVPIPLVFNLKVHQTHLNILKSFLIEERRIELLKEYRQSLISEVVTGKRKVVTYE